MKTIPLTQGLMALVDDEDHERVCQFRWCAARAEHTVYAVRWAGGKTVYLHRFVMDAPHGMEIDHRDRNGLNCQRANLREATRQQQCANTAIPRHNTSGFKGVSFYKRDGNWQARIQFNRRLIFLGRFDSPVEAARAYDAKARELFGEFAFTNFSI